MVVATDVTSHGGVNSWRRQVDMQFVLLLLRFFLFLEGSATRDPAAGVLLSTTYGAKPVRGYWRVREERHQSRIRSHADLTAQTAPHTCVLVSSPHKISILFKEHSHLHGASNASSAFFRLCTHAVLDKNTRSGSWNAARERMKAVSFCFLCFLEKSQPRAWTWDNERELRR